VRLPVLAGPAAVAGRAAFPDIPSVLAGRDRPR